LTKKFLFIGVCVILAAFSIGWLAAVIVNKRDEFKNIAQAIPIIRYDRFDKPRKALIIELFNPGALPMEISRTKLSYKANNDIPATYFAIKEYGDKPLVLDPGDTLLVPLVKNASEKSKTEMGNYWGQLDFRIPGQVDFYSVHHRFTASQLGNTNNSVNQ
jgi:hypothetical protein